MDGLQLITCVLLAVTSDLSAAQQVSADCSTCPPGYYVEQNCSMEADGRLIGVLCKLCRQCSAVGQVTVEECSMFADSRCGDVTTPVFTATPTPAAAAVSAPKDSIILIVIIISVFMILLLGLLLLLMLCCRNYRSHQCEKPLPPHNKPLPFHNEPLLLHNKSLLFHNKPLPSHNKTLLLDNKPLPPHDKFLPCWSQSSFSPGEVQVQSRYSPGEV
ncbi:uncharacterized protein LOC121889760 [Thunnus maccoyii]|uniref:uncharacterized protein LOC121889760 n=1 Tax=Thunnus maccoyii TaxID=8240 RepID=UPI001C4DA5C8|nr:uncharacterized protein LOC121889760 [Thunnus maccoyii]